MNQGKSGDFVELNIERPVWDRFHTVAPLVLIGTRDAQGNVDLAPKHMATPLGWDNYFGFVCTPRHTTYTNIARAGVFAVSFPRPEQMLLATLSATPRCADDSKPILEALDLTPATRIDADVLTDAYLYLECEHHRTYDDFGANSLIAGRIVAARIHRQSLRAMERDDQELIHDAPLLAYLHPGRYASVDRSFSLPLPAGMKK